MSPGFLRFFFCSLLVSAGLTGCGEKPQFNGARVAKNSVESVVSSVNAGTVRAEQQAELAFGAVGRVQSLNVKLGDSVKKGAVLAELENNDLRTSLWYMDRELARRKELAQKKLISATDFEEVTRQHDLAAAALEKSLIRAPFDGIVTELNLEVGQLSQITAVIPKPLIKLIDQKPRFVRTEIDELDLGKISIDLPARVKILTMRREPFNAKVRQVVPFISTIREQDRTAEIELTVEAGDTLLPVGASADVEVILNQKKDVLTVPTRAVLGRQNSRYLFVFKNGRAVKTPIEVGISGYDRIEIISGVSEGDIVVIPTDDQDLTDGAKVSVTVPE